MYTKYFINITSFILSCLITMIIVIFMQKFSIETNKFDTNKREWVNQTQNTILDSEKESIENQSNIEENINQNTIISNLQAESKEEVWQLMIPKIDLIAPIKEGTDQTTISKTIGHFSETSTWNGNIGLASHNRGMRANFFEDIKNLVKSDLIIYQKGEEIKQYQVSIITIIQDNDWSYLQPTVDNRITLITCVKNQPNYRLCVQGIQI